MSDFKKTVGRLTVVYWGLANGDHADMIQTHRNGSGEIVGEITLDNEQIEDAIYILTRIKAYRDDKNKQRNRR